MQSLGLMRARILDRLWNLLRDESQCCLRARLKTRGSGGAIRQRVSHQFVQIAQSSGLIGTVDAWNIVASLVSQHINERNLGMAKDSGNDSVLMRRIADFL